MTLGRQSYLVLVALALVVAALLFVRFPLTLAQMMQSNSSSSGGCSDIDADGVCVESDNCPNNYNPGQEDGDSDTIGNACDPCPTLWHHAPTCPDPAGADLQFEPGPGAPGAGDADAHLKVWNNSYYEYKVDRDATTSHAYCPNCVADDLTPNALHPPCNNWNADYAACTQSVSPNPKSYGGQNGITGSISPCGTNPQDEILEIGENILEFHTFHNCCDISGDVLYAARIVVKQYRYNNGAWHDFSSPLPERAGWTSLHNTVNVGFPEASPNPYPRNYEGFTVDDVTTSGCTTGGTNVHYATNSLDRDGDSIPNACDCDDDDDCCLDGDDFTIDENGVRVDQSLNPGAKAPNCDGGIPLGAQLCTSYKRAWGWYTDYPGSCRGYAACKCTPQGCEN
jgi:hypothetical protein